MKTYVGTSGWIYKHWAQRFYPKDIKDVDKLGYLASHFNTVEVNTSFYHLPRLKTVEGWRQRTPDDFVFAVKLSRYITHQKKFAPCEELTKSLDKFFEAAVQLKEKLGVVLIQLPASFKTEAAKLENLFRQIKKLESKYRQKFPLAIEFRHQSWFDPPIFKLMKKFNGRMLLIVIRRGVGR